MRSGVQQHGEAAQSEQREAQALRDECSHLRAQLQREREERREEERAEAARLSAERTERKQAERQATDATEAAEAAEVARRKAQVEARASKEQLEQHERRRADEGTSAERCRELEAALEGLQRSHAAALEQRAEGAKLEAIEARRQQNAELQRVRDARDHAMRKADVLQVTEARRPSLSSHAQPSAAARRPSLSFTAHLTLPSRSQASLDEAASARGATERERHDLEREVRELRQELEWTKQTTVRGGGGGDGGGGRGGDSSSGVIGRSSATSSPPPMPELARGIGEGFGSGGGSGGGGMGEASADLALVTQQLEVTKEQMRQQADELRKAQEEQLGAALRARRKEKELKEQLRKQGAA